MLSYRKAGRIAASGAEIPDSVKVDWDNKSRLVKLSRGEINHSVAINNSVDIEIIDGRLYVHALLSHDNSKAMSGTYTKIISNIMSGMLNPWQIKIEIKGVGYKATPGSSPNSVKLNLGYSNPVEYEFNKLVNFSIVDNGLALLLTCYDKQVLGQCAAEIYKKRPPNPYSGKGVIYQGKMFRKFNRKEVGK